MQCFFFLSNFTFSFKNREMSVTSQPFNSAFSVNKFAAIQVVAMFFKWRYENPYYSTVIKARLHRIFLITKNMQYNILRVCLGRCLAEMAEEIGFKNHDSG